MDLSQATNWYHSSAPLHRPLPSQWCTYGDHPLQTTILKPVFPAQHQSQPLLLMKIILSKADTSATFSRLAIVQHLPLDMLIFKSKVITICRWSKQTILEFALYHKASLATFLLLIHSNTINCCRFA